MNKDNNIFEILVTFLKSLKRSLPYIFFANILFVWVAIFFIVYEKFNNIFGYILMAISIGISFYSHIIAEDYLEKKYNNKNKQD